MKYVHNQLFTPGMKSFDKNNPLPEHPTPQFRRDSYLSLNGVWNCDIFADGNIKKELKKEIVVPYSPESFLSGMNHILLANEYLHYMRSFILPSGFIKDRLILHIGAVDQEAKIYVNDELVFEHNLPYIPLQVDITDYIKKDEENTIYIVVKDNASSSKYARGKQMYERGGIWYTPISGIWQSVWLESTNKSYLKGIKITPNFDNNSVDFELDFLGKINSGEISIYQNGSLYDSVPIKGRNVTYKFLESPKTWSLTSPYLYDLKICVNDDVIYSYFAMRKFSVIKKGRKYFYALNNDPIFYNGILEQGYWPEGIYTPPTNEAMLDDIRNIKTLGFNMIRKHIKIEPALYYYYCDKVGMVVFQDFVNGGDEYSNLIVMTRPLVNYYIHDEKHHYLGRQSSLSRDQFKKEMLATLQTLYNVPSIGSWTLFNEGWGQFDSKELTNVLKGLDKTRPIDSTSGWFDSRVGDANSHHVYFKKVRIRNDYNRVLVLSEFGGYSLHIKNHSYSNKAFGYTQVHSKEKLDKKIDKLLNKQIVPLIIKEGLSAIVYTQYTDVEDETNGLLTYDRRVLKVDQKKLAETLAKLSKTFYDNYLNN